MQALSVIKDSANVYVDDKIKIGINSCRKCHTRHNRYRNHLL